MVRWWESAGRERWWWTSVDECARECARGQGPSLPWSRLHGACWGIRRPFDAGVGSSARVRALECVAASQRLLFFPERPGAARVLCAESVCSVRCACPGSDFCCLLLHSAASILERPFARRSQETIGGGGPALAAGRDAAAGQVSGSTSVWRLRGAFAGAVGRGFAVAGDPERPEAPESLKRRQPQPTTSRRDRRMAQRPANRSQPIAACQSDSSDSCGLEGSPSVHRGRSVAPWVPWLRARPEAFSPCPASTTSLLVSRLTGVEEGREETAKHPSQLCTLLFLYTDDGCRRALHRHVAPIASLESRCPRPLCLPRCYCTAASLNALHEYRHAGERVKLAKIPHCHMRAPRT